MKKTIPLFFAAILCYSLARGNTYTVTNTLDNAIPPVNSLRWAINQANGNPGADIIAFNIGGGGTITLVSALPTITQPTTINGYSNPGSVPGTIAGRTINIAINANGFVALTINSNSVTISGISIFSNGVAVNEGISLTNGSDILWVWGCYLGVNASGAVGTGSLSNGITTVGSSAGNLSASCIIGTDGNGVADANEGNLISGNSVCGTNFQYTDAWTISGNYIGTNKTGLTAIPNGSHGIQFSIATNTLIGTNGNGISDVLERNVISGNAQNGISISVVSGSPSDVISIAGNYIGLGADGLTAVGNIYLGISIESATFQTHSNVFIGVRDNGSVGVADKRNVVSANGGSGIVVGYVDQLNVSGNIVGLAADGTTLRGNGYRQNLDGKGLAGIVVFASQNFYIGTDADNVQDSYEKNIVSGQTYLTAAAVAYGNALEVNQSTAGYVGGNIVGFDEAGLVAKSNAGDAILVSTSSSNIIIGFDQARVGTPATQKNIIGNAGINGVEIASSTNIKVSGNNIGQNIANTTGFGFPAGGSCGVLVYNNCTQVIVGTNGDGVQDANEGNTITNAVYGMYVWSCPTANIRLTGNYVGVASDGLTPAPNNYGLVINASSGLTIGTNSDNVSDALERNIISGNSNGGAYFFNSTASFLMGNYIGVGANGTTAVGNGSIGVWIEGASKTIRVGSDGNGTRDATEGNMIANNGSVGVLVKDNNTNNNRISRNSFYKNGGVPIDLNNDGHSPNNGTTTGSLPNIGLDYPIITSYTLTGSTNLSLTGYVGNCVTAVTNPGTVIAPALTVEVYKVDNSPADQNGAVTASACGTLVMSHGEGRYYVGTFSVTGGVFTSQALVSAIPLTTSDSLTAIAINAAGNTSEFGPSVRLTILDGNNNLTLTAVKNNIGTTLRFSYPTDNIKYFIIEKSANGQSFYETGKVLANNPNNSYLWVDDVMYDKQAYYRIKAVNINDQVSYSNVVLMKTNVATDEAMSVYPNPFISKCTIGFNSLLPEEATIQLNDMNGRQVISRKLILQKGYNQLLIDDLASIPEGVYSATVITANKRTTIKLVKE
jgi:hypothetical protein